MRDLASYLITLTALIDCTILPALPLFLWGKKTGLPTPFTQNKWLKGYREVSSIYLNRQITLWNAMSLMHTLAKLAPLLAQARNLQSLHVHIHFKSMFLHTNLSICYSKYLVVYKDTLFFSIHLRTDSIPSSLGCSPQSITSYSNVAFWQGPTEKSEWLKAYEYPKA